MTVEEDMERTVLVNTPDSGIHSQFNACMFKPECCQALMELEASRQRVAEQDRIIASWKLEEEAWHEREAILTAERDAATARAEAAERDAERYKFLRDMRHEAYGRGNLIAGMFLEELDQVIDAALSAAGEKGE